MDKKPGKDGKIEGEGSYSGTRAYNEATAEFLKKGKVDEAAKEAERAVESQEAAALKAAEDEGRAGDPRHMAHGDMEAGDMEAGDMEAGDMEKAPTQPRSKPKAKSKKSK
jgi:hypothetical protein